MEHGKILQFNYFHFILTLVFATRTNLFLEHDLHKVNYRRSSIVDQFSTLDLFVYIVVKWPFGSKTILFVYENTSVGRTFNVDHYGRR